MVASSTQVSSISLVVERNLGPSSMEVRIWDSLFGGEVEVFLENEVYNAIYICNSTYIRYSTFIVTNSYHRTLRPSE